MNIYVFEFFNSVTKVMTVKKKLFGFIETELLSLSPLSV